MIRTSIGRPVTVAMAYFTVAVLGINAWRNMPIELLPDTRLPRLSVMVSWPASPETIEAFLTSPLEAEIQQVRGVQKITSTSRENQAQISVEFAIDTDMDFARLELSERLRAFERRPEYPAGASVPVVSPYVPREFMEQTRPLLRYTVTGPYTLEYLREYVDENVSDELAQVEGVGDVIVNGGRARILEIELDERKILSLGLTPAAVTREITRLEIVQEAGAVHNAPGTFRPLAIRQRAESADDIRNLPVLLDQGRVVRVRDVGRVYETWEEPTSLYRIDGFPALTFEIIREPRTNAVATADRVKLKVAELQPHLPPGTRAILDVNSDQSRSIRAQLTDLRDRSLISAAIVLIVLLVFLRSFRAAAIVFTSIAFAVLITLNLMYFGKLTLNVLTLMGLAMGFGLIIDNAIVVMENMYRYRRLGLTTLRAAEEGSRNVVVPVLAATATTIVVLIPFIYLQGELRIYYVPLAIVVGLTNIASMFVTFSFLPALGSRILAGVRPRKGSTPAPAPAADTDEALIAGPPGEGSLLVRMYGWAIRGSLHYPWSVVALAATMLCGSWYLFDKYVTRNVLFGNFGGGAEDTYIDINIIQPRGEALARTDELARFFEQKLQRMPEIQQFVSNVSAQRGNIHITFPDSIKYTNIPVYIKEQMVQYSLLFGGTDVQVRGYGPSFYGGGGGSAPNYSIKILGYNYEQVREIAEGLGRSLRQFSRIREVDTNSAGSGFISARERATEIVVDVDRARLALHDLTARDVVSYVQAAVRGASGTTQVRIAGEELRLEVKLKDYDRRDLYDLQQTLVRGTRGEAVRLADIARIYERQVLSQVIRENQQYQRLVSYEFRGPAKLGDRVKESVIKATSLPPGYTIVDRQDFSLSREDRKAIWGVLIVSILLVFMVTAALFESIRQPFCILLTVPMALIGVFFIFFFLNVSFTREAWIGVIMMGGVVVNNAILLVDHMNHLRRRYRLSLVDSVVRGAQDRVRPIIMTSLTTILGMLPLVLFSETANSRIWNALTYALIGGLSSSTILVLTVTPALYLLFEHPRWPWAWWLERRRKKKAQPAAIDVTAAPA
jgi:HAE1 family hydrophobic/amphiphilic exporter-1